MSRKCIWCLRTSNETTFNTIAHIFPKSLGGIETCPNVCDNCNHYFGAKQPPNIPSVEIAFKEPLNISRHFLLSQQNKGNTPRFKSEYFDYNMKKQILTPRFKYRSIFEFQKTFVQQFKRGIYKIFLEQRSISSQNAFDDKYNFIRHFARYGVGEFPVYYFKPALPVIALSDSDTSNPKIKFTESIENESIYEIKELTNIDFTYKYIDSNFVPAGSPLASALA